jgi:hypothetical protein
MSDTPDSTNTPPTGAGTPTGRGTPKRNTKKIVAATIAVVATLAASGAAVAVNLGASEPPLDPAAGQLTPTAAATSAERVATDPAAVDPTGTEGDLVPQGTATDTRDDCDDDDCDDAADHTDRDDGTDDHDRDDRDDHDDHDDDRHDGADDDD